MYKLFKSLDKYYTTSHTNGQYSFDENMAVVFRPTPTSMYRYVGAKCARKPTRYKNHPSYTPLTSTH